MFLFPATAGTTLMTPYQRYLATLEGADRDHFARVPLLMQFAAEYIGSDYAAFASDHRVLVEANLRCARDFGMDQVGAISDPYRETSGFGAEIRYHKRAVPECVRPPLAECETGEDIFADLTPPDPLVAPRMLDRIEAIRLYRKLIGDQHSVLGWVEGPAALAADLRGLSEFLMDLMEDPEWAGRLMDLATDVSIAFALAQIDAGADSIGVGDAICSQISGELHRECVLPRQKRLIHAIRAAGAHVRLHICGQTRHLWSGLASLPLSIMDCDHMVDMEAARAAFPANLVLAGNLDPVSVLRFGGADAIPEKVAACARQAGSRFMVAAGCEVPSGTPRENLRALCRPLPFVADGHHS